MASANGIDGQSRVPNTQSQSLRASGEPTRNEVGGALLPDMCINQNSAPKTHIKVSLKDQAPSPEEKEFIGESCTQALEINHKQWVAENEGASSVTKIIIKRKVSTRVILNQLLNFTYNLSYMVFYFNITPLK